MKPKLQIASLLLGLSLTYTCRVALAQQLSLSWATTFGHPANANQFEFGPPILLSDTNGDTRLFGECHGGKGTFRLGTNMFPATVINEIENRDIYMARLDSRGRPASVKLLPSTGRADANVLGAAMDSAGNVVLVLGTGTGGVFGSTLAGVPLPDEGGLAIAKVDANDDVLWATMIGGRVNNLTPGGLTVRSVAVDRDGNIVIGGYFQGLYSLEGFILDATGGGIRDVFVAKFSPDGGLLWVRTAGGVDPPSVYQPDRVEGVATDSAGNVFIGGTIVNGASFDGRIVSTVGDYDVFVARYNPNGNLDWVFTSDTVRFQGLRVGRDDRPVLTHVDFDISGAALLRLTVLDNSGRPVSGLPPVLTSAGSGVSWIPFVGMEVGEANELLFVASVFPAATVQFGGETLSVGAGEERLVFGGSLNLDGTWNWLRPVARPHYATNATPERYFLPGPYAWAEMRGFTSSHGALRFAGVYLSPEPFPMADGTLPSSARYDSQFFVAELVVKPSPPLLHITDSKSPLQLAWPSTSTNFVLQSATTLVNGGNWQDMIATPTQLDGQQVVPVETTNAAAFFRLRRL